MVKAFKKHSILIEADIRLICKIKRIEGTTGFDDGGKRIIAFC